MKHLAVVLTVLFGLFIPTACPSGGGAGSSDNDQPPPVGWDGTEYTKCQVPPAPPPGRVFGPKAGYAHILVVITADSISDGKCFPNLEIPFQIHLSGKLDRKPGLKLDQGRTMPWTAALVTPHFEHILIGPSDGKQHVWEVIVHAVTEVPNVAIRCAIFVDNNRASQNTARRTGRDITATASCAASGPFS